MLLGFGRAGVFELPPDRRNATPASRGIALTAAFVLLRALDVYGDPNPWQLQPVGDEDGHRFPEYHQIPAEPGIPADDARPRRHSLRLRRSPHRCVKDALVMFGRVPFAFYVAHFFLIHTLSVLLGVLQGFDARQLMTVFFFYPKGYGVGLPGVYAVWMLVIALLYPFCRWVASVKARRRDWWLSYV